MTRSTERMQPTKLKTGWILATENDHDPRHAHFYTLGVRSRLAIADAAKLYAMNTDPDVEDLAGERFWVRVTEKLPDGWYRGRITDRTILEFGLDLGDEVQFHLDHIMDLELSPINLSDDENRLLEAIRDAYPGFLTAKAAAKVFDNRKSEREIEEISGLLAAMELVTTFRSEPSEMAVVFHALEPEEWKPGSWPPPNKRLGLTPRKFIEIKAQHRRGYQPRAEFSAKSNEDTR